MQSSPCDSTPPRWEATGPRSAPTVRLSARAKQRERNGLHQTDAPPTRGQRESRACSAEPSSNDVDLGRLLLERSRDHRASAADTTEEQARQPAELSNGRKAEPESSDRSSSA